MLKLDKMQITGFKSFRERTEIRFPDGITAVVGPNGCGKSNIGDAINWVLGEQSPKNLRGKHMADVIFNGTKHKKPKGMAEVSLHLRNIDANAPAERRQIVLTRRLFRSGESEYLLNGSRSRLKVIQELLREEHVGAKTYATIEQGRITEILNAKPKERRLIIEDAAGISGIKHKRRLAELKLESTRANLLRVNDIIVEVARQINSLKRQAAKARRYARLRDEVRTRERTLFGHRTREMDDTLSGLREAESTAKNEESGMVARLAKTEATLSAERLSLDEADRSFREAADSLHQLEIEIDREESAIRHARGRITEADTMATEADQEAERLSGRKLEIKARADEHQVVVEKGEQEIAEMRERLEASQAGLQELTREITACKEELDRYRKELFESMNRGAESRNRKRTIEEALGRNVAERASLDQELQTASQAHTQLSEESQLLGQEFQSHQSNLKVISQKHQQCQDTLAGIRERLADNVASLAKHREKEQSARARLTTLKDVATRFAGVSDGVRMLLTAGKEAGIRTRGVVADYVEAGREFESVVESYLAGVLPAVILEDASDARMAVDMIQEAGAGRTTFLCRSQPAGATAVGVPANGEPPVPPEIMTDPRVVGRLRNKITLNSEMNGVVQDRIGDAVVVDTLETAMELHARCPSADYLTRSGEIVFASGLVSAGGAGQSENGLLAHNRQTHETQAELQELEKFVQEYESLVSTDRLQVADLEAKVLEGSVILEEAGRRKVELELKTEHADDEKSRSSRQTEVLAKELSNRQEESVRLQAGLSKITRTVAEVEQLHADMEVKRTSRAGELETKQEELQNRNEQAAHQRAGLAARVQQQESSDREQERLEESVADLRSRIHDHRSGAETARVRAGEARQLISSTEGELTSHLQDRATRSSVLQEMENAIVERRQVLSGSEGELHKLKSQVEKVRECSRAAEMELTRAVADRGHMDDLCRQELGCTASEALEALEALEASNQAEDTPLLDLEALAAEIDEIRGKIDRIGPVNMMAIDEFSDLEERHTFLAEQKSDLERSMDSLQETIRRINRTSRERFAVAFEAIRKNYREIFATLFNGGRADLRLEEGEDMLDGGIEILAQPPGKRLGSIQLLSGGEKSMSAIALLFAIFRFHPSPFCLLDEVDAALDEVNVGRFTRMVAEYAKHTQFILVTHNKVSMESANLLYGVTMEEQGVSRLVSLTLN